MAKLIMIVGASLLNCGRAVQAGPHDERVGALDTLGRTPTGNAAAA